MRERACCALVPVRVCVRAAHSSLFACACVPRTRLGVLEAVRLVAHDQVDRRRPQQLDVRRHRLVRSQQLARPTRTHAALTRPKRRTRARAHARTGTRAHAHGKAHRTPIVACARSPSLPAGERSVCAAAHGGSRGVTALFSSRHAYVISVSAYVISVGLCTNYSRNEPAARSGRKSCKCHYMRRWLSLMPAKAVPLTVSVTRPRRMHEHAQLLKKNGSRPSQPRCGLWLVEHRAKYGRGRRHAPASGSVSRIDALSGLPRTRCPRVRISGKRSAQCELGAASSVAEALSPGAGRRHGSTSSGGP